MQLAIYLPRFARILLKGATFFPVLLPHSFDNWGSPPPPLLWCSWFIKFALVFMGCKFHIQKLQCNSKLMCVNVL